jgi:hypothetical protein
VFVCSTDLVALLFRNCVIPELKVCADIPIGIRWSVIRIPVPDACIQAVIPIAAELHDIATQPIIPEK